MHYTKHLKDVMHITICIASLEKQHEYKQLEVQYVIEDILLAVGHGLATSDGYVLGYTRKGCWRIYIRWCDIEVEGR